MPDIEELMEMINKKSEAMQLIDEIRNPMILEYYDFESDKNLDLKIKVLKQVKSGKPIDTIKEFRKILELYPDENVVI